MDQKVRELLEMLEVSEVADRLPSDLSTGTQRSVAIARALAEDPDAILYDEPTTMVDPLMATHISDLILKLKRKYKKTSIVVTHDTHLAKKLADRVIFLQEGRVGFFGTWPELEKSEEPFLRNFLLGGRTDSGSGRLRLSSPPSGDPKRQLRRVMGYWDVLLFNIAAVLGPRWIAAAAHNGTSSISLWVLAAVLFFLPTAFIVVELSTRFPEEGGLYAWSKDAFGDFHGFVAGWTYWVYTFFYFPGLLMASAAMGAYIGGNGAAFLAQNRAFLMAGSLLLLLVAVVLNIVGLNIGKWLQNAGGVGTYVPLVMLVGLGAYWAFAHGSQTHFAPSNMRPVWNWNTVNFWPQIAFAFTGLELCSTMSEEIHEPHKTFPRAIFSSGVLIALIYIAGTFAVLAILPAASVDPKSGVFQAISAGSTALGIGIFGVIAALLVAVGNAGGIGATVAGVSRIPFAVGIDRYLPPAFGKIHPKWKTPWVAILVQALISGVILLVIQVNETANSAYQILPSTPAPY